jgi:succinate dehydrogenase / fumarate reductase flavoprotein subunit
LREALGRLETLEGGFDRVSVKGNTERERVNSLRLSIETRNLIQVARLLGTAALHREESRGGHFRLDFPVRDDARFLGNIILCNDQGAICHELRPVPGAEAAVAVPAGAVTTAAA